MSFTVYPAGSRTPNVAIENMRPEEPVFISLYEDGALQVVELTLIREWADEMYHNNLEREYEELYVRLPNSTTLLTCGIIPRKDENGTLMVDVAGVGSTSGVLWTSEV